MTPPPVSETAAWTEMDERRMQWWAQDHDECRPEVRFAREILRLRAENERIVDAMHGANAKLYHEVESLRSALAAAQEAPSETDAAAKEQWRSNPPYPVWLVERTDNGYAEWLKSSIGDALVWTTEASEALWHETEDEAHAMIRSVRKSGHYMPTAHATDHRFLARSELAAATRETETPPRCEYESADGQQRCILSKHDEHLLAWKARPEASNANPL